MTATALEKPRLRQLDGLRGLAILLVLAHHLWPMPHVGRWSPPLGHVGVSLFFVLSGFLITGVLLEARGRIDGGGSTRRETAVFYFRRFLRIVPPYALLLVAFWMLDVHRSRERWFWHATYLSNWHLALDPQYANQGYDRHLWSLSVEEQFYLVWPALVLLLPRRWMTPAILLVFVLAPAWRAWVWLRGWPPKMSELPTPANMDLLATGAMLALWRYRPMFKRLVVTGLLCVPLAAVALGPLGNWAIDWRIAGNTSLLALALAGIVGLAATGRAGRWLEWRPLCYVGTISYAAYLVHTVAGPTARWLLGDIDNAYIVGATATMLTLATAAVSWHALESPLMRLRRNLR